MELHTKKWSPHRSMATFIVALLPQKEIGQCIILVLIVNV
jgi:hypothetical protein